MPFDLLNKWNKAEVKCSKALSHSTHSSI